MEELIIKIKSGCIDSEKKELQNNINLDNLDNIYEAARRISLLNKQKEKLHQGSDL